MLIHFLYVFGGMALLILGADLLVRGAAGIALKLGVSALVVGLTVVALGTSAPEMVVGAAAALEGKGGIALGTVFGSNLCNILMIMGAAALMRPIPVNLQMIRVDVPIMLGSIAALGGLLYFGNGLSRVDGIALFAGICAYVIFTVNNARKNREAPEDIPETSKNMVVLIGLILAGLVALKFGGDFLLQGAVSLARGWGVDDALIAIAIIAPGSSLPELATAAAASLKGEGDLVTGNVVGSNTFNTLAVLGIAAMCAPIMMNDGGVTWLDYFIMAAGCVITVPMMLTRMKLGRIEGAIMIAIYVAYLIYKIFGL